MVLGARPAASGPSRAGSASRKSPDDSPCRYSSGNTLANRGDRRRYGGRIALVNRCRCPCTTRRSFTRGAATGIGPTPVVTLRGRAVPLRTTTAWPAASRAPRCRLTYSSTSSCSATSIIRRAPSRASSSNVPSIAVVVSAVGRPVISSSIGGVPFSPAPTGVLGLTFHTSPEGYVAFSLHPQLLVIAHAEPVIVTDEWINTIDDNKPVSVVTFAGKSPVGGVDVRWEGSDT